MQEKKDKEKKPSKGRTYEKPKLRTIELKAEEVLAIGCKMQHAPGPTPGNPANCHGPSCASLGS